MKGKGEDQQKMQYLKIVDQNIEEFGFLITTVLEDKKTTPFGYSTGLYQNYGIPELFISGLPSGLTQELIDQYSSKYKQGLVPENVLISDLSDRFSIYFTKVKLEKLDDYVLSSVRFYEKKDYKYLQLVYPDLKGFFPGEEKYDYDQEIFGEIIH